MKKITALCHSGLCAALLLFPLAGHGAAATASSRFLNDDTLCFQQGSPIPGGWSVVFRLKSSSFSGGSRNQIISVDGLEQGTQATYPLHSYTNELSGTATFTRVNDGLGSGDEIQVMLTGGAYGSPTHGDSANSGLYTVTYSLRLDKRLNGTIIGVKQFTPIGTTDEPTITKIDETLTLLPSCPSGL